MARQVTDPNWTRSSPRVMVNRAWHHLFGRGLVASTDNLGVLGEPPTHPELLDYLADQFVRDGWSLKRLLRSCPCCRAPIRWSRGRNRKAKTPIRKTCSVRRKRSAARRRGDPRCDVDRLGPVGSKRCMGRRCRPRATEFEDGRGKPVKMGPLDGGRRPSIYLAVRQFLAVVPARLRHARRRADLHWSSHRVQRAGPGAYFAQ